MSPNTVIRIEGGMFPYPFFSIRGSVPFSESLPPLRTELGQFSKGLVESVPRNILQLSIK